MSRHRSTPEAALSLPPPPAPRLLTEPDDSAPQFLSVRRQRHRLQWDGEPPGPPFSYDTVQRRALDAVAIVLWRRAPSQPEVLLRASVRPPLAERHTAVVPDPIVASVSLWEVPAGLVEPSKEGRAESPRCCASRETLEETGIHLPPEAFSPLGPPVFPSAGVLAEAVWFVHAEVDATLESTPPSGDGSPLEARSTLRWTSLLHALRAARDGALPDAKTELALRRLAEAAPWRSEA